MPQYKIGLDFGTTNSIISYLNNGTIEAFKYGAPGQQEEYISSFITYEDGSIEIGTAARTTSAHHPDVESYGNFKMRLPMPESEFSNYSQNNRTPISITADYINELLLSPENPYSFSKEKGEIAGLVVSVPEIWQRDIYNVGRERLQKLIKEDLGLGEKLIQLVSEPVAAAAYYAWETQRRSQENNTESFTGNLLVCDMGGGTFDVSICHVYGDNKVEVLYFDGQGDKGLDSAGVAFDRRCVQTAYTKKHSQPLDEKSPEFIRLLKEFETVKIGSHVKITRTLINCLKTPEDLGDRDIYFFAGGYAVTFNEIIAAFAPIAAGIQRVMQQVQDWLHKENKEINRLFLVGGFSQFLLVQKAIADALSIGENDPRFDRSFNLTSSAYAISYGACLIANGLVDPTEKYVHSLGIVVDTINARSEREQRRITIIEGGANLDDLAQPNFAKIPPLVTFQSDASLTLTLWVDPQSKGRIFKEVLPEMVKLPSYSPDDRWRVGMKVDRSQVAYLVIEEFRGNKRVEYELGNVIAKMFPGFVLIEDY